MRRFDGFFSQLTKLALTGLALLLGVGLLTTTTAADGFIVHVTATVAPTASIIVNQHDRIEQIISNTAKPTVIYSYLNSLRGPEVALNSSIMSQYQRITKHGRICHPGVIFVHKSSRPGLSFNKLAAMLS